MHPTERISQPKSTRTVERRMERSSLGEGRLRGEEEGRDRGEGKQEGRGSGGEGKAVGWGGGEPTPNSLSLTL